MRDLHALIAACAGHGPNIGIYAERVLDDPLPWTRMRAVYRLLGLVRRYGPDPVEEACSRALDLDVVSVTKIASMLERSTEQTTPVLPAAGATTGRFARQPAEFATAWTAPASQGTTPAASQGTTAATEATSRLTLIHGGADAAPAPQKESTP